MELDKYINVKEYTLTIKAIMDWYRGNKKFLNIATIPYTNIRIFYELINEVIRENGKVLYVWGKSESNTKIVNLLRENNNKVKVSYFKNKIDKDTQIIFAHYTQIDMINSYFNLIIFDDISCISQLNRKEIESITRVLALKSNKILVATIERIINRGEFLEIIDLENRKPFIEPRVLITRVDFKKDVPYSLYDYLKWFYKLDRQVFILVPYGEKITDIKDEYKEQLKYKNINVKAMDNSNKIKGYINEINGKKHSNFIVTNFIGDYLNNIKNLNIVLLFTREDSFSYKEIIYFCSTIYKNNNQLGELIIVSKEYFDNIEKARDISRKFNKLIWEKGIFTL